MISQSMEEDNGKNFFLITLNVRNCFYLNNKEQCFTYKESTENSDITELKRRKVMLYIGI